MKKYLLKTPEKLIKAEIINVLKHNKYVAIKDGEYYVKTITAFGSVDVEIKDYPLSYCVEMSCTIPDVNDSGLVTLQIRELFDKDYSMYNEHTIKEIMFNMMNDFYTRAYFMTAISYGKKVCVCEDSKIPTALSF